ncbi:hypothetical protein F5984_13570 [Rudanella paleaurantiibacter]|uniref:Glycosyl hydrolase 109 C-terminal domain-containing protein n=1 Tax=Rudanella paleaurantiibacter TaxID=2614655 RepID=A0A7J5TYH1_9BACT|nr:hypothetical protein [Rudanella paleaurantiibacter]KAB7730199.1 hypothetical protein F5984_13570 [Rudanella paleaurantiibacter]
MRIDRRTFIRTTALSGVGLTVLQPNVWAKTPASSVGVAFVSDSGGSQLPYLFTPRATALFDPTNGLAFERLLNRPDIDLIVADLAPVHRSPVAHAAMRAGKHVVCTGPVGQGIGELLSLYKTHRQTGRHCLILDDDRADRDMLAITSMVKQGLFGPLTYVHCGSASATNGLGMAMDWLGILNGNAFKSLNASLSKSWGLHEPSSSVESQKNEPSVRNYQLGEVLTITLQCANGELVVVNRDLAGQRPYGRGMALQGRDAKWDTETNRLVLGATSQAFSAVRAQYEHPYPQGTTPRKQPNALSVLLDQLETNQLAPEATQNALMVSLIHVVAKHSLAAWGEEVQVPDLTIRV